MYKGPLLTNLSPLKWNSENRNCKTTIKNFGLQNAEVSTQRIEILYSNAM